MKDIIDQLKNNMQVFHELLKDVQPELIHWRPAENKWCLLDVVCHLYDEERDDFRFRIQWLLDKPGKAPPPFNPLDWVIEHDYENQEYDTVLKNFLKERETSISWLKSLKNPNWENAYENPKRGVLSASYFLNNWLAHDYLHMRQILKLKFEYLEQASGNNLNYAGIWQ